MRRRIPIAITATIVAAAGTAATAVAVRDAIYVDQPLPGVVVSDAGLSRPIAVLVDGKRVLLRPDRALKVDRAATARTALEAGRHSFLTRVRALADPSPPRISVAPVLVSRPQQSAQLALELSSSLPKPAPARITLRGLTPRITASKPGTVVDRIALVRDLRASALERSRAIAVHLRPVAEELDTAAAEDAAATAQQMLSAPVRLRFRDRGVGAVTPPRLARLLRFTPRGDHFAVTFAARPLADVVRPALAPWRRRARNARFLVEGERVRIFPSRPGLEVNPQVAVAAVTAAALSSDRRATLALRETRADRTTRDAQRLGIREQISTFTTDMGVSSSNRVHNVQLMAQYVDGTIIKPGESFSFNDRVGPRTVERGFREGQMIIGSLLLPSIGGGVCQTATTLFNNAFELGLPIERRYNHSFYISHYPLGRDATVSWGGPDLAFRNDLKTGILIKTTYTSSTLTFSFYGTDPGRRIVSSTGPQLNWRQPETTYALDPYAPAGSVRTVAGSNQPGFDVTVTREVYERGRLKREDAFTSAYIAVGPTAIYGPGRSIPGPYFILPRV